MKISKNLKENKNFEQDSGSVRKARRINVAAVPQTKISAHKIPLSPSKIAKASALPITLLSIFVAILSIKPIMFVTADLGRHLKNGEIIAHHGFSADIFRHNFYSYTHGDFPFVNHHWGAGYLFFLIKESYDFEGLAIFQSGMMGVSFFAALMCGIALIFWKKISPKNWEIYIALLTASLATIPLILSRNEIRPESFSALFSIILFAKLLYCKQKNHQSHLLLLFPPLMLFWCNIHIYFIFGLLIYSIFLLDLFVSRRYFVKETNHQFPHTPSDLSIPLTIGILGVIACLINPIGLRLVLYPASILVDYGYKVAENQSVPFFWKYGLIIESIHSYHCLFVLTIFLLIGSLKENGLFSLFKMEKMTPIFFIILGGLAIRNFALSGLFAIPWLVSWFTEKAEKGTPRKFILGIVASLVTLVNAPQLINRAQAWSLQKGSKIYIPELGGGLFMKENRVKGPIFNNYDIGGYLIYHIFPHEKVFVDNRPEAYPSHFFENIYVPMQENESIWQDTSKYYQFNTIYFFHQDMTPAAQTFLKNRLSDPSWVPIYADPAALILVRNSHQNMNLIKKFRIPKEAFGFSPI